MSIKNKLLAIAGTGTVALKAVQGFAMDSSRLLADGGEPSLAAYGTSEIAKIGSAVGLGVFAAEGVSRLESLLKFPRALRGMLPVVIGTVGAGVLSNIYGNVFGIEQNQNLVESTKDVLNNYWNAIYQVSTFNPDVNSNSLAGAVFTIYSAGRLAVNNLIQLARVSGKADMKQRIKDIEKDRKYRAEMAELEQMAGQGNS